MTLVDSTASAEKRMRSRTISAGGSTAAKMFNKTEKSTSDYTEISSIPPLPLYALVAADEDISHGGYKLYLPWRGKKTWESLIVFDFKVLILK